MVKNHWTILIGLIIITGMLIAAAFSLGLYVGERGLIETGIQQGINQPRQTANNQQATQAPTAQTATRQNDDLPAQSNLEEPDLTGRFMHLDENLLILNTPNGVRQIIISEETRLTSPQKGLITWQEVSRGDTLAVFGVLNEDNRQLEATRIILLPVQEEETQP